MYDNESISFAPDLFTAIKNFLIVSSALISGLFIGVTSVALFMYRQYSDDEYKMRSLQELPADDDYEDISDSDDEIGEEDRFYNELAALEDRVLSSDELEELRFKTVTQKTPEGEDIILLYHSDTETFWYYVNNNSIVKYNTLDAIARYYAIQYNCRSICVNYKAEIEKGMAYVKNKQDLDKRLAEKTLLNETEEDASNKPRSVFAKFKNYNTTDKKKAVSTESKNTKQYYVLTERANRFKYRGKLNEYLAVDKTAAGISQPKLDYSSFKLLTRAPDIKLD